MSRRDNAIGGYFTLEVNRGSHYHKDALRLNTAKNCLEYILRLRKYSKVYIPAFTCKIVQVPFYTLGIKFSEYSINKNLEPFELPELKNGEAFLYTNYFGIKSEFTKTLAAKYGSQLIVDNAQAFFDIPINGIDTFYSSRKFFGVPDGAYLYTDKSLQLLFPRDISYQRLNHLVKRIDLGPEQAYEDFTNVERMLSSEPIKQMSLVTESLLMNINYKDVIERRMSNFRILHKNLCKYNLLKFDLSDNMVPMVYPYMTEDKSLKDKLISQRIFIPTYWPNVIEDSDINSYERYLTNHLCPLPIDQRYDEKDMDRIINIILKSKI